MLKAILPQCVAYPQHLHTLPYQRPGDAVMRQELTRTLDVFGSNDIRLTQNA